MDEPAKPLTSFWEELRRSVLETVKPQTLILYGVAVVIFSILSLLLPYEVQVYSSISAGIAVALLLFASMVSLRGFAKLDMVFIGGIAFLIIALFPKEFLISLFPTQDVLRDFKHLSRILSITLTASYVALRIFQATRIKSHGASVKNFSSFFSVCNTTISSELCSCLHPIPFLDALLEPFGVAELLLNRVKLGFVIMMFTFAYQGRATYEFYKSRADHGL